ncbi:MAG: NAD(P)/FAD-dependent oxidoreductase, partial [Acidobacteriota bacterium]
MTRGRYDAVVIGAGHNGLVCAAYLARAGKRVLVLERRHVVGGAAVSEEVFPGFTFSVLSYVVSLFRPSIIRDLDLPSHGMEILPLETAYTPHLEGPGLCRWPDQARTRDEISRFSRRDADIYPEFSLAMTKVARFARNIIDAPAPIPSSLDPRELMTLLRLGKSLRGENEAFLDLQTKLLTMSAVDFLERWFESDALMAPMS